MSELKAQLRADLKTAMKAKEKERTGTIRMLLAAIQTAETEGTKHEVDDQEIQKIIAREIKKRRESAEIYSQNGREDLAESELAEAEILASYQPKQLDDEGRYWSPGIRDGVRPGSWFHLNECFGPVLGIMHARDLDEAIEWQNSTGYLSLIHI